MEEIYSAMSDTVRWIEEEYGMVAAWAAAIAVIFIPIAMICGAIAYVIH